MHSAPATLGFIGLGVMGRPMVSHLAAAGHALVLHDRVAGLAEEIAATLPGARVAATPAALAAQSEIVVTMVPNGSVVRELIVAPGGCSKACAAARWLLDTSSSEPG